MIARMDEYGKLAWLAFTIVAFWLAWPLGLAAVAFLVGSGRFRTWRQEMTLPGRWSNLRDSGVQGVWSGFTGTPSSGNDAFDAYRRTELERLEREQQEFKTYLERLRTARDKAEFDRFMAERRPGYASAEDADAAR